MRSTVRSAVKQFCTAGCAFSAQPVAAEPVDPIFGPLLSLYLRIKTLNLMTLFGSFSCLLGGPNCDQMSLKPVGFPQSYPVPFHHQTRDFWYSPQDCRERPVNLSEGFWDFLPLFWRTLYPTFGPTVNHGHRQKHLAGAPHPRWCTFEGSRTAGRPCLGSLRFLNLPSPITIRPSSFKGPKT